MSDTHFPCIERSEEFFLVTWSPPNSVFDHYIAPYSFPAPRPETVRLLARLRRDTLYDQHSLAALEEDIRTVETVWFTHEDHTSVDEFACYYPLAYHEFGPHDRYSGSTQYEMSQLFRVFLLKALHGWHHETALLEYLNQQPKLCEELGFDTLPDQSTLWRSWHQRFTPDLRETGQTAARTILIKATQAGVAVPWEPTPAIHSAIQTTRQTSIIRPSSIGLRISPNRSAALPTQRSR